MSRTELTASMPIVGVGVMIIDCENRVLLGHRIKIGESPTWCFPGGKIEAQESLEQSAVRELFEETHLRVEASQLKPFVFLVNRTRTNVNVTTGLVVNLQSDEIKQYLTVTEPHIFQSWHWFDFSTLPHNLFPETEVMIQYWTKQKLNENFSVYPIALEKI